MPTIVLIGERFDHYELNVDGDFDDWYLPSGLRAGDIKKLSAAGEVHWHTWRRKPGTIEFHYVGCTRPVFDTPPDRHRYTPS